MRKVIICLVLVFACLNLLAQTETASLAKSLLIKVNPLSLFDPRYPTLQTSVEGYYGRVGLTYTFGPAINTFLWKKPELDGTQLSYKGSKHKVSVQYRWKQRLIGVEYFTTAFQKERENGEYYAESSTTYNSYDYVKQKVNVWGMALKVGVMHHLNERFFLVYTNSFGVREQTNRFTEARNLQAHQESSSYRWGIANNVPEGTKSYPHFAIELAFGYKIF